MKYLQHYLDELRGKVDITVALIHEGVPARQSSIGNTDVRRALDTDIQTASKVKGLDILITGHAHVGTPEPIKVGNTLILSTDSGGIDVGKLVLNVDPAAHTHKVKSFELKTLYAVNGNLIRQLRKLLMAGIKNWQISCASRSVNHLSR